MWESRQDSGQSEKALEDAFVCPSGELDREKIAELLTAIQSYATAVRPRRLGELGKAHIDAAIGGEIVRYRRIEIDDPYAPILAEVALVYRGKGQRAVTVGINSSPALAGVDAVPYLTRCFQEARVDPDDPVWFFIHLTGPGFRYTDRGKSRLALPLDATRQLYTEISAVLEPWRKYKKRKERDEKAELMLGDVEKPERPPTLIEAAEQVIPAAYAKASDNGALKVAPRQIMYAGRDAIQKLTGKALRSEYFTQTLLPNFIAKYPELTKPRPV